MNFIIRMLVLLSGFGLVHSVSAQQGQNQYYAVLIRPNASLGFLATDLHCSAGARALLKAGGTKAYGVEFSYFRDPPGDVGYFSAGIMLEQKLFGWFNMGIGTIGYFNYAGSGNHVPVLSSNLGWEPEDPGRMVPFIAYRSDVVFARSVKAYSSLNVGLGIKL